MTTLYEVLGVQPDASGAAIRKAFRRATMRHHPDKNPGDAEAPARMQAAREAYEVLSDPARRARYDRTGDYSKPNANDERAQALQILGALMGQVMAAYHDGLDPIASLRSSLAAGRTAIMAQKAAHERTVKTAEKLLRRLRFRGQGDDVLAAMVRAAIADGDKAINALSAAVAVNDAARAILDEYEAAPAETREALIALAQATSYNSSSGSGWR